MEINEPKANQISRLINDFIVKNFPSSEIPYLIDTLTKVSNGDRELVANVVSVRPLIEEVKDSPIFSDYFNNDSDDHAHNHNHSEDFESYNLPAKIPKPKIHFTIFLKMVFWNKIDLVKAFLEHYPTIDLEYSFYYRVQNETALFLAISIEHHEIAELLLKHGANVNHLTSTGSTSLRLACYDNNIEIAQLLLDHEADINLSNNFGNTPLMAAAFAGHKDICELLIRYGAKVDAQAKCSSTALHYALQCHTSNVQKMITIIDSILSASNDPRSLILMTNDEGFTPLMLSVVKAHNDPIWKEVLNHFLEIPDLTTVVEKIDALEYFFALKIVKSETFSGTDLNTIIDEWIRPAYYLRSIGLDYGMRSFSLHSDRLKEFAEQWCPNFESDKLPVLCCTNDEFQRLDDFYRNRFNRYLITKSAVQILERTLKSSPLSFSNVLLLLVRTHARVEGVPMNWLIHKAWCQAIRYRIQLKIICGREIRNLCALILVRYMREGNECITYLPDVFDVILEYYRARPRLYGNAQLRFWRNSGKKYNTFFEFTNISEKNEPKTIMPTSNSVQDSNYVFFSLFHLITLVCKIASGGFTMFEMSRMQKILKKIFQLNQMHVCEYYTGASLMHTALSEGFFILPDVQLRIRRLSPVNHVFLFFLSYGGDISDLDILYNSPLHLAAIAMSDSSEQCNILSNFSFISSIGWNDFPNSFIHQSNYMNMLGSHKLDLDCPRYYGGCQEFHFDQQNIYGHDYLKVMSLKKCELASTSEQANPNTNTKLDVFAQQIHSHYNRLITLKCLAARVVHRMYFRCEACRLGELRTSSYEAMLIASLHKTPLIQFNKRINYFESFRALLRIENAEKVSNGSDQTFINFQTQHFVNQRHPLLRFDAEHVWRVMNYMSKKLNMSFELVQFIEMHGPCKFIYQTLPDSTLQNF